MITFITNAIVFIAMLFFIGCVVAAVGFQVLAMFAGITGIAMRGRGTLRQIPAPERYRTVSMRVRDYDVDEDY